MFLFIRLLLAHFLADFPFQFNAIFRLKLTGFRGTIPHALIVFACFAALAWPYLRLPQLWAFIFFVSAVHLVQDTIKIKLGARNSFWSYCADQLFHLGTIAAVFLTDLGRLSPPAPSNLFVRIYLDNLLALFLIAIIVATYNGYFLIRCFKDTYAGRAQYNDFEKWYGMAERALIVMPFFIPGPVFFLLPVILILRPLAYGLLGKRYGLSPEFKSFRETILSWSVAVAAGWLVCLFQANYPIN